MPSKNTIKYECVNGFAVSTIYLPVDHGHNGIPVHHETYVFEADENGEIANFSEVWGTRYYSEEEARQGHEDVVERIKSGWTPSYDGEIA